MPFSTQLVAVAHGGRARGRGVAARAGLGQPPGAELLALRERHQVALLLRFGAEHEDVRGARGRCARPPTARRRDRRARAPRCRGSSRWPTCPAPPYSSGNWMPISPSAASFGTSSRGKCCASSHSRTCGRISASANSRTVLAQQVLIVGEPEVHRSRIIARHLRDSGCMRVRPGRAPGRLTVSGRTCSPATCSEGRTAQPSSVRGVDGLDRSRPYGVSGDSLPAMPRLAMIAACLAPLACAAGARMLTLGPARRTPI